MRLATHYRQLDPDVPAAAHAAVARQHLAWLEQHARRSGYGSGNWETHLAATVDQLVVHDKPLAYVLGTQPFFPLRVDLAVRPPILVPRPETEHWVLHLSETILAASSASANEPFRIVDIGTGSGCIALALSQSLLDGRRGVRGVETVAVDQSPLAVALARENVARTGLDETVAVAQLDLFDPAFVDRVERVAVRGPTTCEEKEQGTGHGLGRGFDLVVSNPPYITRREFRRLDRSVRAWEDRRALLGEHPATVDRDDNDDVDDDDDDDGLIFYRTTIDLLDRLLRPPPPPPPPDARERTAAPLRLSSSSSRPPNVAFEVGQGQARRVVALLDARGFDAEVVSDPWGVERAVFGWKR
ncbi:hypothetical protein JCM11491_000710 [Sporobolomyces phaffii]